MNDDVKHCPRCGSDEIGHGYSWPPMSGNVCCYSDGCEAITVADTEHEAIALWNDGVWHHRPIAWDDFGTVTEYESNPKETPHDHR